MANPYGPSPYQDVAQSFQQVGPVLNDIVLGLAQQKYSIAQANEQMRFRRDQAKEENALAKMKLMMDQSRNAVESKHYDARNRLAESQGALADSKSAQLNQVAALGPELGKWLQQSALAQSGAQGQGALDSDVISGQVANVLGQLSAAGQFRTPVNAAQIMDLQDPRLRALMSTNTKIAQTVPKGGGTLDPLSGLIQDVMPQDIGQGHVMLSGNSGEEMGRGMAPNVPVTNPITSALGAVNNAAKVNTDVWGQPVNTNLNAVLGPLQMQLIQQLASQMSGAQPTSASVAAQQPAVGQGSQQIPPPQQREVGKTYQLPKGAFTWTAEGWVPAVSEKENVRSMRTNQPRAGIIP
jgi:hypothetical protein